MSGQTRYEITRTASEPIQGMDGRWYVAVLLVGAGITHVPVDEMQLMGG
ncbi:hypothetical protein [Desulfohalovibrio reitneri]|nr:hypothetical protein [Desulfohalovibrio reitneri]